MADTSKLKSMINSLINDKHEEASLDLHAYLTDKMREVSGIANTQHTDVDDTELDD